MVWRSSASSGGIEAQKGRPLVEGAGLRAVLVEELEHAPLGGALVGEPGFVAFPAGRKVGGPGRASG